MHRFSFFCLGATLLSDDIQQAGQGIARRKNPSPLSAFVLGPILHLVCPQFCCFSRAFVGLATAGESASSSLLPVKIQTAHAPPPSMPNSKCIPYHNPLMLPSFPRSCSIPPSPLLLLFTASKPISPLAWGSQKIPARLSRQTPF